jgi:hypothetical protein
VLQGRYRILSKIASGAMGVVYKGERMQLGRPVAVKFLHPWIAAQKAFRSRFETEAKAMSRLGHPHCVSVIDFGVDGAPYLVMDYVTGRTLRDVLAPDARVPAGRALHIVRQLLAGLGHAHAQGIVHRDLKPENLILTDEEGLDDHLRILDFGLAKLRDGPAMTAGMAVGTPSYMSPEQSGATGAIDARTDLYAVGVLLFELLAGRKPFESNHIGDLILMHRETPAPALRQFAPDANVSPELEAVVLKGMAKFQDDRFQSAAEFAAALDETPEGKVRAETPRAAASASALASASAQPPAASARPVGLPAPPPTGRPPQRPPEPTIVDTRTAVMRRHGLDLKSPGLSAPAAAADAADPSAAADKAAPGSRMVLDRRHLAAGIGLVGFVILAVVLGFFRKSSGDRAAAPGAPGSAGAISGAGAGPAKAAAPGVAAPSGGPRVAEAQRLAHNGQWEPALAILAEASREEPGNADVDYMAATINLEHHRSAEGLAAAHAAIHKNPTLKSDGDLIKAVIDSLASDKSYERSQSFLRGLGGAATPFLKEAARHHGNPKVRQRAAEILDGNGGGRSVFGSSSSRSSSSGSLFKR